MKEPPQLPAILFCRRLPARLTRKQTADLLGIGDVDLISAAVEKKLLRSMKRSSNKDEYGFFADEIEQHAHDRNWMEKMNQVRRPRGNKKNGTHDLANE
jgi:hypothetical protein